MKTKVLTIISILVLTFMISGCATLLAPSTNPLAISSEPRGVEVYVNGYNMGKTPLRLDLKADKSYTIEYRKEGYESVTRIVNNKVGAGWVILDVICGLLPVIVDAATGAWYELDQSSVNAVLVEQNQ